MNKRVSVIIIILLILVFAGYLVIDTSLRNRVPAQPSEDAAEIAQIKDMWHISRIFEPEKGVLNAIAVTDDGRIIVTGGDSFIAAYDSSFKIIWEFKTEVPVTAISICESGILAATGNTITIFNLDGEKTGEWGPLDPGSILTSIAAGRDKIAVADAGTKSVYILDAQGSLKHIIGREDEPFIIPSAYFDVDFTSDEKLLVANTGNRRIETRELDGTILKFFGKAGSGADEFSGCCNPAHFIKIPGGYVTAEKGINRIKILDENGDFIEFVSSLNNFVPSSPLDLASADGAVIYCANHSDSKIYIYRRNN